jgi:pimeloyl-ACP methyl ester carboxylesterase
MPLLQLLRGGVQLTVESCGSGSPLIFAHGLTGNRRQSQRLVGALRDAFQVITFDQRGHAAHHPNTDSAFFEPNQMADDMIAALDALGIERAAVGGASMGAATALLCALHHPERVTHLVLTAPAFSDRPNPAHLMLAQIGEEIERSGVEAYIARLRQQDWPAAGMTQEAMTFRADMLRSHDPTSIAAACRSVANWVLLPDLAGLARLATPTRIIAWEGDAVHPWALAARLALILPNAQIIHTSLPAYHNEPGLVARLVRTFLMAPFPP